MKLHTPLHGLNQSAPTLALYFKISTLKSCFLISLIYLFLVACSGTSGDKSALPPPLYSPPVTVPLNLESGYLLNSVGGDSTTIIINSLGDTVKSGIQIPAIGIVVDPDSVDIPKRIDPGEPKILARANSTRDQYPMATSVISFDQSALNTTILGEGDQETVLTNSIGDTVPSGITLPFYGEVYSSYHPQLIEALRPTTKDDAIKNISYLDVDQGMLMSYVMTSFEDSKGNLWFGTQGEGVSRYNGAYFTHFTYDNGLVDGRIWSILEDKEGNMWFGSDANGLSKYDGQNFTSYYEKHGLSIGKIKTMFLDSKGNIWLGTGGNGVSKIRNDSIIHYGPKEGLRTKSVVSITEDDDGILWFGTYRHGIIRFDGHTFTEYTSEDGLPGRTFWGLKKSKDGGIWIASEIQGFSKLNNDTLTYYTPGDGSSPTPYFGIDEDQEGNLWLSTRNRGIEMFDGTYRTTYSSEEGMSSDIVWDVMAGSNGIIWVGSIGGGGVIVENHSFRNFTSRDGLISNFSNGFVQDNQGRIWFGTDNGGLHIIDNQTISHFSPTEQLQIESILCGTTDTEGNLWFATYGTGVFKYDGTHFTHYTAATGLCDDVIYAICEDKEGNIWFGSQYNGISKFDGHQFTNYSEAEGLSSNYVYQIRAGRDGNLWLASSGGGITRFDGTDFTHFTEIEGLVTNNVWEVFEDKRGDLWVGTAGMGLCRFTLPSEENPTGTFTTYGMEQGLSDPNVYSVMADPDGNLWLSGDKGLSKLTFSTDEKGLDNPGSIPKITHFTKKDGLKSSTFNTNAALLDKQNRAWWGGNNGVEMLDLNHFRISTNVPQPVLQQVDINGKFIDYRENPDSLKVADFDSIARFQNVPVQPVIPFTKNHLTFYFAAHDWLAPHKVKYSFRIKELGTEWSEPANVPKADYRNIPYGDYTFQVCAIGESQQWSKPLNYSFTIDPPWWHTWWARAGYLLAGIFAVLGIVRWRTEKLREEAKVLEHKIDEATVVIRKQKEEVEAEKKVSDELLLNILPAEVAEELKQKGRSEAKHFDDVSVLFTDFKDFTSISERLTPTDLVAEIDACFRAYDEIVHKYNIEKIKTVGDAYMAAGGLPVPNRTNATDAVNAALDIRDFMHQRHAKKLTEGKSGFEVRIGIHTGPVVAGIVGIKKFQYDIWGDTVNTASRMESASEPGKVNVSDFTYQILKDDPSFTFESRGEIEVKGKGAVGMWYVERST